VALAACLPVITDMASLFVYVGLDYHEDSIREEKGKKKGTGAYSRVPGRVVGIIQEETHASHASIERVVHHPARRNSGNSRHANTIRASAANFNICACPLLLPLLLLCLNLVSECWHEI